MDALSYLVLLLVTLLLIAFGYTIRNTVVSLFLLSFAALLCFYVSSILIAAGGALTWSVTTPGGTVSYSLNPQYFVLAEAFLAVISLAGIVVGWRK